MPDLILVRHAAPEVKRDLPPTEWPLAPVGRATARKLADQLRAFVPVLIAASPQPKAAETGAILAAALATPLEIEPRLAEHERGAAGFLRQEEFEAAIARFFATPDRLVFGSETADQAHGRFVAGIDALRDKHPADPIVIVAHGTVIALFVSRALGIEPFSFWHGLAEPTAILVRPAEGGLQRIDVPGARWR